MLWCGRDVRAGVENLVLAEGILNKTMYLNENLLRRVGKTLQNTNLNVEFKWKFSEG